MPIRAAGQGASSVLIRHDNQRVILQRLRRLGEASRADLARDAALTHTAVGQIVRQLESGGLVRELGRRHHGQRGQPATLLALDPRGAYAIGVRLDRARIETVLVDLAGTVLGQRAHNQPLPTQAQALECLREDVEQLSGLLPAARRRRIAGVGIARPAELGGVLSRAELERDSGLPVLEEHDGTAAAIAELFHGHGRARDDFLYVFIGAAIGGGVVLGGQALRGSGAGIGAMPVAPSRLPSAPKPAHGHETLAGRAAIAALLRHLRYRGESRASLTAPNRTRAVEEWLEDCTDAFAAALLAARALLGVPAVIIDSDLPARLIDQLIARLTPRLTGAAPVLLRGSFGPMAGALGAATLPLFLQFAPGAGRIGTTRPDPNRPGGAYELVA